MPQCNLCGCSTPATRPIHSARNIGDVRYCRACADRVALAFGSVGMRVSTLTENHDMAGDTTTLRGLAALDEIEHRCECEVVCEMADLSEVREPRILPTTDSVCSLCHGVENIRGIQTARRQHTSPICTDCIRTVVAAAPSEGRAPTPPGWAWEKAWQRRYAQTMEHSPNADGRDTLEWLREDAAEIAKGAVTCNE